MEGIRETRRGAPVLSGRSFKEQIDDDGEDRVDGTLTADGPLAVTAEDDTGGDPYNHTGSFERINR